MTLFARIGALVLALSLSLPALAMSLDDAKNRLDQAKQQGIVGETPTGYLDVVKPTGQARDIVEAINKARREEYARIATKHGIAVSKVEAVAGQKAMDRTPSGQFILINGEWVVK
ncbi:YdbL family protein [Marinobacter caseinilyticus]|uniref:YdbL family protein n=1 Tax=Marinobacter caseinilyticus TaxID=2692195 RepID=UPI00140A0345|nr:YdbL family protein [Marinobacter caseinilyticus]